MDSNNPVNPIPVAPKFNPNLSLTEIESEISTFVTSEQDLENKYSGDSRAVKYLEQQGVSAINTFVKVLKDKYPELNSFAESEIALLIKGKNTFNSTLNAIKHNMNVATNHLATIGATLTSLNQQKITVQGNIDTQNALLTGPNNLSDQLAALGSASSLAAEISTDKATLVGLNTTFSTKISNFQSAMTTDLSNYKNFYEGDPALNNITNSNQADITAFGTTVTQFQDDVTANASQVALMIDISNMKNALIPVANDVSFYTSNVPSDLQNDNLTGTFNTLNDDFTNYNNTIQALYNGPATPNITQLTAQIATETEDQGNLPAAQQSINDQIATATTQLATYTKQLATINAEIATNTKKKMEVTAAFLDEKEKLDDLEQTLFQLQSALSGLSPEDQNLLLGLRQIA